MHRLHFDFYNISNLTISPFSYSISAPATRSSDEISICIKSFHIQNRNHFWYFIKENITGNGDIIRGGSFRKYFLNSLLNFIDMKALQIESFDKSCHRIGLHHIRNWLWEENKISCSCTYDKVVHLNLILGKKDNVSHISLSSGRHRSVITWGF